MMNYTTVSIKDVRDNLSDLVEKAALAGESFLITKFGKPKALIVSADIIDKKRDKRPEVLEKTAGLWADRKDIKDAASYVAKKRKKASSRYEEVFS